MFNPKKIHFISIIFIFALFFSFTYNLFIHLAYTANLPDDFGHQTTTGTPGQGTNVVIPPPSFGNNGTSSTPGTPGGGGYDNTGSVPPAPVVDPNAADPVNVTEGDFNHTVTDLAIPTVGIPLEISRTYHSRTTFQGYFGYGWTSLFDMNITETQAGDGTYYAEFRRGDGITLRFKLKPDGITYESPKGWDLALKKVVTDAGNGYKYVNYFLKEPNGTEYHFNYYLLRINQLAFQTSSGGGGTNVDVILNADTTIKNYQWQNPEGPGYNGLQAIYDRYGNKLEFRYTNARYDSAYVDTQMKRVVVTHWPSGKSITLSRENLFDSNQVTLKDDTGREFIYKFNGKPGENLESVTDPMGNEIKYTYNGTHDLLTIKNQNDVVFIDNSYDTVYDRVKTQVYNGGKYTFNYGGSYTDLVDRRNNTTKYTFDTSMNITQLSDPFGKTTVQTYDTSNNKIKTVTQGDHKTAYGYDSSGNVTQIDKYTTTNISYRTRYEYETTYNQVTKTIRSKYNWTTNSEEFIDTTVYEYYGTNSLYEAIRGYGTELADTTYYEYFEGGSVWRYGLPTKISNSVNTVEYGYDSSGWVTAIKTYGLVDGNYKKKIVRRGYDDRGNVTNEKVCIADADGSNEIIKSETILHYNALNQLKDVTDLATGKITGFDYDPCGNLITTTNAEGLVAENIYNEYSQLKAVVRRSNGVVYDSVGYGYDSSENLKTITDASGRTTSYEYDQLDRVKKITDPLNNITQFGYDQWGNLLSKITPNSKTISYEYDWLNRMTKKKYTGTTDEFSYSYKEDTPLLLIASAPSGTINYDYDKLYRLKQVIDPYYNTTGYEYEGNRRKTMTVSKTNKVYQYFYDYSNQLLTIKDNYDYYDFQYDAFGRMNKKLMPNGTYTEYTSDHLGRLKSLMNYKANNSVISQYLSDQPGDFDLLGNRKKVGTLDGNFEYKYDSIYQLTELKVNSLMSEVYQYDSVGNRLKALGSGPDDNVYDSCNRLLTLQPTPSNLQQVSFTYDNNGSRVTKTDTTGITGYIYDYENRLKRVDFADSSYAEYTYDALGRRIEKSRATSDGQLATYRYSYDGEDIIAVLDSANTAIASITHGPGIDHPLSYKNIATGQTYYYHQDYLGSITSITDSNQNVVETYKYDAFGNLLQTSALSLQLYYAYTGREFDPESGLYFYRARYYDSKVGRFLQADPIGFLGGMNFYAYVGNNSLNYTDPLGLTVWIGKRAKMPYKEQHGVIHHEFIKINEHTYSLSTNYPIGGGHIVTDGDWDIHYNEHDGTLEEVPGIDEDLLLKNIEEDIKNSPFYILVPGLGNCQDWVRDQIKQAKKDKQQ